MRSPADRAAASARIEGVLRGAALAALVLAVLAAWWLQRRGDALLAPELHAEWSGGADPMRRDSLAALARAGRRVSWSGDVRGVMAVAEPLREPVPAWRIAAVGDSVLVLRDSLGPLDSIPGSGTVTVEPTRGAPQVREAGTTALAGSPSPAAPTRIFVFGRVGWEPRFAITALEERGWGVDAQLDLGRGRAVRQGSGAPDATRHQVVIVFDSASARRERATLLRVLGAGGGVILAGEAARTSSLPARRDSLRLAVGDSSVHAAARRVGSGRLIALAEAETWRWRMQGEGESVEAHRAFWSQLAGIAAPVPRAETVPAAREAWAAAPRAALVQALGPERPAPRLPDAQPARFPWWLGPIILIALLAEWSARRRRGVP